MQSTKTAKRISFFMGIGLVLPNSLIIISWIWDKSVNGRLHPVLGWSGAFIIAEQTFEVIMFDTPAWRLLAKGIFDLLAG
jgi:hypothetical protein